MGLMFHAVVYVSGYLFLLFTAVCLGACSAASASLHAYALAERVGMPAQLHLTLCRHLCVP